MNTSVPATPELGDRLVTFGVGITVRLAGELWYPSTRTYIFPVNASAGTATVSDVSVQLVGVAYNPFQIFELNRTTVESKGEPKFVPVMVSTVPAGPETGEILEITGVA